MDISLHEYFMKKALMEAQEAWLQNEIPIGAILIDEDLRIIAKAHNQVELLNDPTAHAEMICLSAGFEALGAKYLPQCTLYVTVEPCMMCAGALYWSQIGQIVYGTHDYKRGHLNPYILNNKKTPYLHPKTKVIAGILQEDCAQLISSFFKNRRN